jgi:hypothetical protein
MCSIETSSVFLLDVPIRVSEPDTHAPTAQQPKYCTYSTEHNTRSSNGALHFLLKQHLWSLGVVVLQLLQPEYLDSDSR